MGLPRFSPAVRHLLAYALFLALGRAVWSLLFNLYLKQVGYQEDLIGDLNFAISTASAVAAPVAALLSNRLGRRNMLLAGAVLEALSFAASVWVTRLGALFGAMVLQGIAYPLWAVPFNPYLAEQSDLEERVAVFSSATFVRLLAALVGNVLGGLLPALLARALGLAGITTGSESVLVFRLAATGGALCYVPALLSLSALRPVPGSRTEGTARPALRPLPPGTVRLLAVFVAVSLLIGLAYGFYFPFTNLYFKEHLGASPGMVGVIMGVGQAAGCLGLLLAPRLARRLGKIRTVTLAQTGTLPFLAAMALAPTLAAGAAAYLARFLVWNTGSSSFDAYQMEAVPDRLRTVLTSLAGMPAGVGFNLAYALGSAAGGWLIVAYGYPAIFYAAMAALLPGTLLYYWRFGRATAPAARHG
jgi:MFS family permease